MRSQGFVCTDQSPRFRADDVRIGPTGTIDRDDARQQALRVAIGSAKTESRGGLTGWQQKRVSGYIDAHLGEGLRLSMLAELVDLSPFHFARAFKQSFGVPPHRYHVSRRIARAKEMLDARTLSVTAIARDLGFAETSSFSATFRRVTGMSPMRYRRSRP